MDRSTRGWLCLSLILSVILSIVVTQSGCVSALATVMWVVKGNDVKAEYDGLRGKRVAVVCRPLVELQYTAGSRSAQELAAELGRNLSQRVSKITIIDPRKVMQWTDEHETEDLAEVGKALKADVVLCVNLEEFSLFQSQTLYQGKSTMDVTVYDVAEHEEAWHKSIPRILYPPNRGVDTSMAENDFRRQFISHLAETVGRHFYSHDPSSDFALDSRVGD